MFAKEGYPYIVTFAVLLILVLVLPKPFLTFIALALLLLMLWFFRDPERVPPADDMGVVAPADGRVVEISEAELYGEKYIKVGIFMNIFSVHVNRVPFSGAIAQVNHIYGKFLNADDASASVQNERNEILIDTAYGRIAAVQVAGLIARRTVSYVRPGDTISKGERMGLIKFSSRVDLYLPLKARIEVGLGHKTLAGETIVAHFRG